MSLWCDLVAHGIVNMHVNYLAAFAVFAVFAVFANIYKDLGL